MPEQKPIFDFVNHGTTIFGITNNSLWRLKEGGTVFSKVAKFDNISICRKIEVWRDRIYITTDMGLLVSAISDDISKWLWSVHAPVIDLYSHWMSAVRAYPQHSPAGRNGCFKNRQRYNASPFVVDIHL